MDIVQYAFAFSDIEVLKAYIDCFDPGMWLSWSTRTADSKRCENMKEVANLLEKFDVHWRFIFGFPWNNDLHLWFFSFVCIIWKFN